jgi:hypothetical protein
MEINEKSTPRMVVNGTKVIDTFHAVDRYIERVPSAKEEINDMLTRIVKHLETKARPDKEEYLFFSRKFRQGIVVAYREERAQYATDDKKHVVIITVLPKGKDQPKAGTPKIVMEAHQDHLMSEAQVGVLDLFELDQSVLNESIDSDGYETVELFENLGVVIIDGKAYNFVSEVEIVDLDAGFMGLDEFIQYATLDEGILIDILKATLPKPVLHWLKQRLHKTQYRKALETYQSIMKDAGRNLTPQAAIVAAAKTVGISPRELQKVWDTLEQK